MRQGGGRLSVAQDTLDSGAGQRSWAGQDVYAAARDQTVIDDSRVELPSGSGSRLALAGLVVPLSGLPRRLARVFEGALGRFYDALPLGERAGQNLPAPALGRTSVQGRVAS